MRDEDGKRTRRQRYVEILSIILLSSAGVATSWSSYQAARWGGVQSASYSKASGLRLESTRASSAADQLRAIDIAMFAGWVEAYATGDEAVREFYEKRFRDEFKPAFQAWIASEPLRNPDAPPAPFYMPEYRLARAREAFSLVEQADQAFDDGERANDVSDAYVLIAVRLAMVLFFAGIAQLFRVLPLQTALLAFASALLIGAGWNLLLLPSL